MKYRLTCLCLLITLAILPACEKFEFRGFISSYETVNERFNQSMTWNRAHPVREVFLTENNYLIYTMGDSHVGGTKNLNTFFQAARDDGAAATVMVGDLTTGHQADYETFASLLPDQETLLTFPLVGNHDLYFDGWKQYYSIFGFSTYAFVIHTPAGSDLFLCLDSGGGTLGTDQLAWLKNILETRRENYRFCMVFTHNNIFRLRPTTSTNPFVEEIRVLLDLFLRHRVEMVVTAHDHKRNTDNLGQTTHIIMDALSDDCPNAGYLKIYIQPGGVDFDFIDL